MSFIRVYLTKFYGECISFDILDEDISGLLPFSNFFINLNTFKINIDFLKIYEIKYPKFQKKCIKFETQNR